MTETWSLGMFVVDLFIKSELLTRVSDEELVEECLNDARCRHLTEQIDTRQSSLITHTRSPTLTALTNGQVDHFLSSLSWTVARGPLQLT